jgi:hypothetical protein
MRGFMSMWRWLEEVGRAIIKFFEKDINEVIPAISRFFEKDFKEISVAVRGIEFAALYTWIMDHPMFSFGAVLMAIWLIGALKKA